MNSVLASRLDRIEAVLERWLSEKQDNEWFEKVFYFSDNKCLLPSHAVSLCAPCYDLVHRGGKRWRPLLMTLVAESLGGEAGLETALPLTPLVEFPHNASLIHDDIEDSSDERRGKPAVHLIYGEDTAINSGAFLYFLPLACLENAELPAEKKLIIYKIWGEHMRRLHLGQSLDISWHREFSSRLPSVEEYERMCRLKTGCLASLAASLGVIAADRTELIPEFGDAAEKLGVGFQILDDVKNLTTGVPGKKRGDDVVEGKKSLPVLLYLHKYPEKWEFAAQCFTAAREGGVDAPEVETFIAALSEAGALSEARKRAEELITESSDFLIRTCGTLLRNFIEVIS
jgi:octaprenyl-diphosphate synthase